MDNTLTFAQPLWIWIGLAVCVALVFGVMRWNRRRENDLEKVAHSRLLRQLTESVSRRRRYSKQGLWIAGVFCIFIAMARPQYGFEFREVKRRGIDLVFAVDTSRSMLAEDVVPNRLERARLAITDFVEKLEGDRAALIPFAGSAFSLCPLTLDYSAFFQSLDALDTGVIPHLGTDLASAVREANRLFDEEGNNHRILILITDGEDLQGSVMEAVATAKEKGMTIHTVGVGDPAGALIPITMEDGSQDFVRGDAGQPVRTALDEATLRKISEATGGIYAPLGDAGQGLHLIYQEKLRLVPKSELNQRLDRVPLERYEWPLAVGILLLLVEFLLGERRRERRRQTPLVSVARRKKAMATSAILFAGLLPQSILADAKTDPRAIYNSGTEAYRAGDFATAEEVLADGLGATDDLSLQQRSYYNLGNARYRLGEKTATENSEATIKKWESAVKSFEDALALNPGDEDAKFNRDFVKEKLKELKKQQDQQQQNQEEQKEQDQQQREGDQESEDQQESGDQEQNSESGEQQPESKDSEDSSGGKEGEKQEESSDEEQSGSGAEKESKEQTPSSSGEEEPDGEKEQSGEEQQPAEPTEDGEGAEQSEQQPTVGEQGEEQPEQQSAEPAESGTPSKDQADESRQQEPPASFSEERREPGEMSKEEATQLLEALESDERSVIPLPNPRAYRSVVPNNTTRGKTW